jgi:hypothetical protein
MAKIKTCTECGLPYNLGKAHNWQPNGAITEKKNPDHRMLFLESESFDPLFHKIGEMVGVPIEHIVQEGKRKVARQYLETQLPKVVRRGVYAVYPRLITQKMADMTRCLGLGDVQVVEARKRKEGTHYTRLSIEFPYSIMFFLGDTCGGMEAASGRECKAATTRMEGRPEKYIIDLSLGPHSPEMAGRLQPRTYVLKPGDIAYKHCMGCGIPNEIAEYQWNPDRGTITHPRTGHRSVILGPGGLEAIFEELEAELGEDIPETVIEAQRVFSRAAFRGDDWLNDEEELRRKLALRGLGLLSSFSREGGELNLTLQNSCVPLLMVGLAKGLFELKTRREGSSHTWSRSEDGDLTITISPA